MQRLLAAHHVRCYAARMADSLDATLLELFDAERKVRSLHDKIAQAKEDDATEALAKALDAATKEADEGESALRLVRIAELLGEFEGPRVVDLLVDILGSTLDEPRSAAGAELEALAFDRFKEVAKGLERALKRLPVGSPALPELPYILAEVPEPGVLKLLGEFVRHDDADAVAAAIEVSVEIGDPAFVKSLKPLVDDNRTVELADDIGEGESEVTIGELAQEAIELLEGVVSPEEEELVPAPASKRGGGSGGPKKGR
jgi:hypothetical protein